MDILITDVDDDVDDDDDENVFNSVSIILQI